MHNQFQRICLFVAVIAFAAICLMPPWQGRSAPEGEFAYAGHRKLPTGPSASVLDRHAYQVFAAKTRYGQRIYLGFPS